MTLNPEVAEAIRIADHHLAGEAVERRKALALDIQAAIVRHAGIIANDALRKVLDKARNSHKRDQGEK